MEGNRKRVGGDSSQRGPRPALRQRYLEKTNCHRIGARIDDAFPVDDLGIARPNEIIRPVAFGFARKRPREQRGSAMTRRLHMNCLPLIVTLGLSTLVGGPPAIAPSHRLKGAHGSRHRFPPKNLDIDELFPLRKGWEVSASQSRAHVHVRVGSWKVEARCSGSNRVGVGDPEEGTERGPLSIPVNNVEELGAMRTLRRMLTPSLQRTGETRMPAAKSRAPGSIPTPGHCSIRR